MLSLMRWLGRLSLINLQRLGSALGWLAYALSGAYRQRLRAHVQQAGFGPVVRRQAVAAAGRMVAELPWLWLRPLDRPLGARVQWQGAALIEQALDAGRGLVLLTPHLGSFEVCAQAIAERWGQRTRLTAMYRPARQPWLRTLQETARNRPGLATAPAALAGVRQMIRALRRGECVGVLPDQVPPEGMGVWAPFFGRPAYTMTLASRLVQQTGAAWLLIWAERLPQGAGWVLRVSEPSAALPATANSDAALQLACASALNDEMARLIAQQPGQYLWGYHRYKQPRRVQAVTGEEAA
ncbi:lysophospholipid acyltransferase family protein [Aquabacterium sp. OR-4]|uniref:lysophospholipid acyltransferase family protein n=1 Tax=Aquabacterium sp. OR-4 TaxID=2978127 RepID=UPI0021B41EAD|nr:lysophospholipid acyltransferase family protein [Aquabacterium sp. OR-4]MDT7837900.1 lysophospholipid acyltransferase family protein [Aquabacterium sp. OR-4]